MKQVLGISSDVIAITALFSPSSIHRFSSNFLKLFLFFFFFAHHRSMEIMNISRIFHPRYTFPHGGIKIEEEEEDTRRFDSRFSETRDIFSSTKLRHSIAYHVYTVYVLIDRYDYRETRGNRIVKSMIKIKRIYFTQNCANLQISSNETRTSNQGTHPTK